MAFSPHKGTSFRSPAPSPAPRPSPSLQLCPARAAGSQPNQYVLRFLSGGGEGVRLNPVYPCSPPFADTRYHMDFFTLSSLSVRRSPLLSTSLGWIEGWIAMARTVNRLTDRTVRALKAPGFHHDGGGLYLQVSPSGAKSWVFRFKINGRRRDMGLGKAD